jgi:hypothetical protein
MARSAIDFQGSSNESIYEASVGRVAGLSSSVIIVVVVAAVMVDNDGLWFGWVMVLEIGCYAIPVDLEARVSVRRLARSCVKLRLSMTAQVIVHCYSSMQCKLGKTTGTSYPAALHFFVPLIALGYSRARVLKGRDYSMNMAREQW